MKIGSVVRKYNIPVNRIYFYINNGLLVPSRHNNQYDFDAAIARFDKTENKFNFDRRMQ